MAWLFRNCWRRSPLLGVLTLAGCYGPSPSDNADFDTDGSGESGAADESETGAASTSSTGSEETGVADDTGGCPAGTESCSCTEDHGCDPGLSCDEDVCVPTRAECGNGLVEGGEACDDGNADNTDSCLDSCILASCGDGFVGPGEGCDDGNDEDDDACTSACALPSCGDAIVQQGEACDDGNADDGDACLATCVLASCGDGYLWGGNEACDDGNEDNGDGCSATCLTEQACFVLDNTPAEDFVGDLWWEWFEDCVDARGTQVRVVLTDKNDMVVYEATGTKVGTWSYDYITSTADSQANPDDHDRIITLSNGDKLMISGSISSSTGCGGDLGNGYGIAIYPSQPDWIFNQKLLVYPYRRTNGGPPNPREFFEWDPSKEISWQDGAPMGSCLGPQSGFEGRFELYVFD